MINEMHSWEKAAEDAMGHYGELATGRLQDETRLSLRSHIDHPDEYVAYWDEMTNDAENPRIIQRHVLATGKTIGEINECMMKAHGQNWSEILRQRGLRIDFFPAVESH